MANQTNGDSTKNKKWKYVYGPVYPLIEEKEMIKIPTEKAGYLTHKDMEKLQKDSLEIATKSYSITRDANGKIIQRKDEKGMVLTNTKRRNTNKDEEDKGL